MGYCLVEGKPAATPVLCRLDWSPLLYRESVLRATHFISIGVSKPYFALYYRCYAVLVFLLLHSVWNQYFYLISHSCLTFVRLLLLVHPPVSAAHPELDTESNRRTVKVTLMCFLFFECCQFSKWLFKVLC